MAKDYYALLGVSKEADEKAIKEAYRRLARKYHPDLNPGNSEAEAKFKEINEAYETLGDPEKRRKYDRFGSDYENFQTGSSGSDFGEAGMDTIFEQIFHNFGFGYQTRGKTIPSQDLEQVVEVTLEEIDKGTKRTLQYQTQDACENCKGSGQVATRDGGAANCPYCQGTGIVTNSRKVEVTIPPGFPEGKKLRVPGRGIKGNVGKAGDLYITVKILPHQTFVRRGDDLEVEVLVDYLIASLGGKVKVPTLASQFSVTVPPGTQSGQVLRLKQQGLSKQGGGKGDLLARAKITVPKTLADQERKLLEEILVSRGAKI
ncbi:MAG: J domain-containing protein [Fimbriimonadaceae bacterium]|jgi:DnaJ-class molecular chaperone|nr:J domain-containing protein [Fimbriimonadaceae bacterium]